MTEKHWSNKSSDHILEDVRSIAARVMLENLPRPEVVPIPIEIYERLMSASDDFRRVTCRDGGRRAMRVRRRQQAR